MCAFLLNGSFCYVVFAGVSRGEHIREPELPLQVFLHGFFQFAITEGSKWEVSPFFVIET
jgi:hypothetical protein